MRTQKEFITDQYGTPLFLYQWHPDGLPRAILQIVHGMAEHAARYEHLAKFLTDRGFAVYADDHRGHGFSVLDGNPWGMLADEDGFTKMVENEKEITDIIRVAYPNTPVFLLGHSMGSFISRHYMAKYGHSVDGLILSGTGNSSYVDLLGGLIIATAQCLFLGDKSPAKLIDHLVFGGYNRKFSPSRTAFDWLSRDEKEVDKYIQDPMCGNVFPARFYADFFRALLLLKRKKSVRSIPVNVPVLFFSGEKDPVGDSGRGVRTVYETFNRCGIRNLEMHLLIVN